jgi:hypothetical protein
LIKFRQNGGFATSTDAGAMTNFVEIGQARDKILSLKLDQVSDFVPLNLIAIEKELRLLARQRTSVEPQLRSIPRAT